MQNFVTPKLETFMEAQWMRVFLIAQSIEFVWLIKVHVESRNSLVVASKRECQKV